MKTEVIARTNFNKLTSTHHQNEDMSWDVIDLSGDGFTNEFQFYGTAGIFGLKLVKFVNDNNTFYGDLSIRAFIDPTEVFKILQEIMPLDRYNYNWIDSKFYIYNNIDFIEVYFDLFEKKVGSTTKGGKFKFSINSVYQENIDEIKSHVEKYLRKLEVNSLDWAFTTRNGIAHKDLKLNDINTNVHDEFYPQIKEGLDSYYERYLKSDESVLLLVGIPGTGKTTFIKNLLYRHKLNAIITYDQKLMEDDAFFLDFVLEDKDLLIIEDADAMIKSRDKDENSALSKVLNVSEGLVKGLDKKIIFSTNITDKSMIDSALTRPGRCFDVLDFREFTYEESMAAIKSAGIERDLDPEKNYTLAELLSNSNNRKTSKSFKVGFYS